MSRTRVTGVDLGSIRKVEPKGFSNGFDVSGKKTSRKRTRFWSEARCRELRPSGEMECGRQRVNTEKPIKCGSLSARSPGERPRWEQSVCV